MIKTDNNKQNLPLLFRKKIIDLAYKAQTGHIGSCLSAIDILIQVFTVEMTSKDKFILSKGHAALALFVVLNYLKKIPDNVLNSYLQDGSYLGMHPTSVYPDDIPLATGSLGHGLSFSAGLSLAYKMLNRQSPGRVYCLISDGECNEGMIWEAAQFASKHELNNLIVIIDKNNLQAFGKTKDVLGLSATTEKWRSFGFNVYSCDGHDLKQLSLSFNKIKKNLNHKPHLLICNTIKGKGISFMENKIESHYIHLDKNKYHQAIKCLMKKYAR